MSGEWNCKLPLGVPFKSKIEEGYGGLVLSIKPFDDKGIPIGYISVNQSSCGFNLKEIDTQLLKTDKVYRLIAVEDKEETLRF